MTFDSNDKALLGAMGLVLAGAAVYGFLNHGVGVVAGVGAALALVAVVTAAVGRGSLLSRIALPAIGMGMVALLIHAARGDTTAHFAVFAFLACTIVYRDWVPVVSAAGTIALHHLSFNYFQQWGWGPICFTEPGLGTVIEHALYVVAQSAALIGLAMRARADFRAGEGLVSLSERLIAADGRIDLRVAEAASSEPATRAFAGVVARIANSLRDIRATTDSISTAASEVSNGSADLGRRTEQTASNLQQAASSMEQLTGTVRQTAESARTANQLASSAAEVASRGGEVVQQVVATMGEISAASRKIADIIGTIDGIAFQTNILALNAAVEAARAGEQGRGFAVVAAEVRSLASRSAEAAKQIKGLIGASVDKVESGSKLVGDAGQTMAEIVASVQRVNDMIGEITAAATEQSEGLGSINTSVTQLDQMTQQNAALVEQSAAAAESLKDQARMLGDLVSRFALDESGRRQDAPALVD
jgi:methyl-accepting chemotaxis protein